MEERIVYAKLRRYRQPPRKVRLVANIVKGMMAQESIEILNNMNKKAAKAISKLIKNAVSNAVTNAGMSRDKLYISEIRVDESDKRLKPFYRARGRLNFKTRRLSNIVVGVSEKLPLINKKIENRSKN